jgi:hypothetical protein
MTLIEAVACKAHVCGSLWEGSFLRPRDLLLRPGTFMGRYIIRYALARLTDIDQYGRPVQILDMGYTDLDEETWKDYLDEMRLHYTAEKVRRWFFCSPTIYLPEIQSITS